MKEYYVYMLASDSGTLYIGMTNNLKRRIYEHKEWLLDWFTKKYWCKKLVYYEIGNDVSHIIMREKQLKKCSRKKKEFLINLLNPKWRDLYNEIF